MARTRSAIGVVLAACAALPAPSLAQGLVPEPIVVTFIHDELENKVVTRDGIHRTNDRLRAGDLAIRVHIKGSMDAIMQGHTEGFALFDTWYRRRDAQLRDAAAQSAVIAGIFGKALGLGLSVMFPGVGTLGKVLITGLTTAYDAASKKATQFEGGDVNAFIAAQRLAIEGVRSSYLAQADSMLDSMRAQQPRVVEAMRWEYLADAEERGDPSSGLSPHVRQVAAHHGIPEPNEATIARTKLAVLEAHIRAVYEVYFDSPKTTNLSMLSDWLSVNQLSSPDKERYLTLLSRKETYRHAFAGQPDRYCPVELELKRFGFALETGSLVEIINKEKECLRWRTASR